MQAGVSIPGRAAESDDSSSAGNSVDFSDGEIADLTDVERAAYRASGPPPPDPRDRSVPSKCGIAPFGRSWQDREWRRQCRKEYHTAAANAAGLVAKDGKCVHFIVTTRKDRVAKEATPTAYDYIEGTMTAAWDTSEFMPIEEWLEGQESAREAQAVAQKGHAANQPSGEKATQADKGHAADQPQAPEQQREKGHAADEQSRDKAMQAGKGHAEDQPQVQEQQPEKGEKETQGSGISTQKLRSTPRPPLRTRRAEPAMKKAPRSSVGQPLVAASDTDNPLESEESVESDTISSRVRTERPNRHGDAVRRQKHGEKEQREREARKVEDKKVLKA